MSRKKSSESIVRDIKRRTRRKFSSEEKIRIVLDVLNTSEVSATQNMLDLGITSLNVMQILFKIKQQFSLQLSPCAVYENLSIRELSNTILSSS